MLNEKGKEVSALVWYASCKFKRGGRNMDGQQMNLEADEPALSAVQQWCLALQPYVPPANGEGGGSEERGDECVCLCGGSFTSGAIIGFIADYLKKESLTHLAIYNQVVEKKSSSAVTQGRYLAALLKAEIGTDAFQFVFAKKVMRFYAMCFSQKAHLPFSLVVMQAGRMRRGGPPATPTTYTVPEHDRTHSLLRNSNTPQFRRYFEAAAATAAAAAGAAPSAHQQAAQEMTAAAGEDSPEKQENRELRARFAAMELELQRYKALAGLVCVCVCVCCVCVRVCSC